MTAKSHPRILRLQYIRTNLNEWESVCAQRCDISQCAGIRQAFFNDLYKLSTMTDDEQLSLSDVSEVCTIFALLCKIASSYYEFLESVKSKRYTMARIKRICMCALLGIKAEYQKHPLNTFMYWSAQGIKVAFIAFVKQRLTSCDY